MHQTSPNIYMLRTPEAARYVGLSISTMNKMRVVGGGPRYVKLGKAVAYSERDLAAWLDAHYVSSTSQRPGASASAAS